MGREAKQTGADTGRKPGGMTFETFVERRIREAIERGDLDNLPGAGKPLPRRRVGGDSWIREHLEREGLSGADLLPTGLRLRKERESLLDAAGWRPGAGVGASGGAGETVRGNDGGRAALSDSRVPRRPVREACRWSSEEEVRRAAESFNRKVADYIRSGEEPRLPVRMIDADELVGAWASGRAGRDDSAAARIRPEG